MTRASAGARPQPLIAVRDVKASTRWYEQVLGARRLGDDDHGGIYQRLMVGSDLALQLHSWDDEDHPNLIDRDKAPPGHGVLLWFEVADFDAGVKRIAKLKAEVVEGPLVNPNARHREIWLRDPDGYIVVLASPDGEAGEIQRGRTATARRRPATRRAGARRPR